METNNNNNINSNNGDQTNQSSHEITAKQLKRQRIRQIVVSLIGVAILVWGIVEVVCLFMDYKSNEKSDDAQVERYISPVNMRVSGYIKKIYFKEHQDVKKGDTLLVLDDREYRIRVMEAEAALKDAMAGANVVDASLQTTQTSATVYEASIAEIEIRLASSRKTVSAIRTLWLAMLLHQFSLSRLKQNITQRRRNSMLLAASRRLHTLE